MFLDDEFLLSEGVGPFGGFHLAMIQPSFIDLEARFEIPT